MSQSLARLLVHIVFSTKNRERWLDPSLRPALFAYMATIGRDLGCEVYRVGGVDDHVHVAIDLAPTLTVADFVKKVKVASSVWIKEKSSQHRAFEWQAGYGAFSIGQSQLGQLAGYIDRQEEHHRKVSFKEEYLTLLKRYGLRATSVIFGTDSNGANLSAWPVMRTRMEAALVESGIGVPADV